MKTTTQNLIEDLISRTKENLNTATQFMELPVEALNHKETPEKWSALECIEHLNRYGNFYIPEIDQRLKASNHQPKEVFKSGWLGNYFAKSMLPQGQKMKTFAAMNPSGSDLDKSVIEHFISHQHDLLQLLDRARKADLGRIRTSITISKWITLKLGDTFRVVIYHNQRHIEQALRAVRQHEEFSMVV